MTTKTKSTTALIFYFY